AVTVRVMVAVPVCPAAGVTVTVRPAPEPPMVTFPFGTIAGFDDWTLTTRLPAAVSASPTVNPTGPTAIPVVVCWFDTSEIVGGVFGGGSGVTSVSTTSL